MGKFQAIDVESLVDTIGRHHLKLGVPRELISRFYRVTWQGPDHLSLEEFDGFKTAKPIFSASMEAYVTEDRGPERTFTDFAAQAVGEITAKGKLRLSSVKPQPNVPQTIVYSPHLLLDPERGLHNTETTLSSGAAPKGR